MKDFFDKTPLGNEFMEERVRRDGPNAYSSDRLEFRRQHHIPRASIDYEKCHNTRRRNWIKGANAPIRDIIYGLQPGAMFGNKRKRTFRILGKMVKTNVNLEELIRKCAYGMRDPMIGAIETAVLGTKSNKTYNEYFTQFVDDFFTITGDKYIEFPYIVESYYNSYGRFDMPTSPSLRCGEIPQSMFNSVYFFNGNIYDREKNRWYNPTYQLVRVGDYFVMPLTVKQSRAPRSRRARWGESKPFTLTCKGRKFTFSLMEELWLLSLLIQIPRKRWPSLSRMVEMIYYWTGDKSDVVEWEGLPEDDSLYMAFLRAHRCIRSDDTVSNLAFEMFPKEEGEYRLRHLKAGCDFLHKREKPKSSQYCWRNNTAYTVFWTSFCIANLFFSWCLIGQYDGNNVMWACFIIAAIAFMWQAVLTMRDRKKHDPEAVAFLLYFLLAYGFGALYPYATGDANLVTALQCLFWLFSVVVAFLSPIAVLWLFLSDLDRDSVKLDSIYDIYYRRRSEYNLTQPEATVNEKVQIQNK